MVNPGVVGTVRTGVSLKMARSAIRRLLRNRLHAIG